MSFSLEELQGKDLTPKSEDHRGRARKSERKALYEEDEEEE